MTGGIDSNTKEITVASGSILWSSVNVPNPDDSSKTIGTVAPVSAGAISDANPGYIWVGPELIEYRKIDGNVLSNLRRGVLGTPIIDHDNNAVVRSASTQHDIPDASKSARWSAFDPGGTKLIDKTLSVGWDDTTWDTAGTLKWDESSLDANEQAIFIRAGGNSNFNLYNTTYATPGYATPQSGTTGYFSEE